MNRKVKYVSIASLVLTGILLTAIAGLYTAPFWMPKKMIAYIFLSGEARQQYLSFSDTK